MNEQTNSLVVRATPEDQATMKQLIDELQAQIPAIKKRIAKVYQFVHAEADSAQYILRDLFPEARFREDDQTGTLAATALPKEHEQIAEVIKQLDVPGQQSQQTTEIYRFDRTPIRSAEIALERMAPRARVSPIYGTNAVIATGPPNTSCSEKPPTRSMAARARASPRYIRSTRSRLMSKTYSRRSTIRCVRGSPCE